MEQSGVIESSQSECSAPIVGSYSSGQSGSSASSFTLEKFSEDFVNNQVNLPSPLPLLAKQHSAAHYLPKEAIAN